MKLILNEIQNKELISKLLTRDKSGMLRAQGDLTSNVAREELRKRNEIIIQASIDRRFQSKKENTKKKGKNRILTELEIKLTKNLLRTTPQEKLLNKFKTGQSLTPTQLRQVTKLIDTENKKLSDKQINLLKNAPKEIVTGLFEVGKDTVMLPVDAIKGSYNYGISLVKRFENRENNPLMKDIVKLGSGTSSIAKFVLLKPKKAAAIVGLAGAKVGKTLFNEFINNPIKTTTKAIAILFSGKFVGKVGEGIKKVSGSEKVRSVLYSQKFTNNKFVVRNDLVTGFSKITGKTEGTFLNGKKFTTEYKIKVNPKTKEITGQLKTTSGKKTKIEEVNLVDKQGYYLNVKTGEKIPKIITGIKSRSITLKETTLTPIKGTEKTFVQNGVIANTKDADFTTIITRIIDNSKKVTKRTGTIKLSKATKDDVTKIKNFAVQFTKEVGKVKRTTQSKPLTDIEIKRLESFIDNVGIKNLKGLDRRIKIAKVLGITKTNKIIKPLEQILDKFGQVKKIKITKGKAIFKSK